MELPEYRRAYLAGMFDHSGTTAISYVEGQGHKLTLIFTHMSKAQCVELGTLVGLGSLSWTDEDTCRWNIRYDEVIPFLDIIEPYLVIKAESAKILRDFLSFRGKTGKTPTQEMIDGRHSCMERLNLLNRNRSNDSAE